MTYCSVVTVLAIVGLTKKCFGHHAILKILSLRSPSIVLACMQTSVVLIAKDFAYFTNILGR